MGRFRLSFGANSEQNRRGFVPLRQLLPNSAGYSMNDFGRERSDDCVAPAKKFTPNGGNTRGRSNAAGSLHSTGLTDALSFQRRNVAMLAQSIHNLKSHLFVLVVALLLAATAVVAPVVVEEATTLSVNPATHACGGQSGGC